MQEFEMNQLPFRAACATGALACLFASGCASTPEGGMAFSDGATTAMGAPGLSAADRHFALVAAGIGRYEMMASQLAMSEAADPRLRDFAQRVAQDQADASAELMTILNSRGIVPRQALPPDKQEAMNSLGARAIAANAADFDNAYIHSVGMQGNAADIRLFEQAANSVTDPALRTWAVKTLPMMQAHQAAAQQLAPSLVGWDPVGTDGY
jgi:putative membrane protein